MAGILERALTGAEKGEALNRLTLHAEMEQEVLLAELLEEPAEGLLEGCLTNSDERHLDGFRRGCDAVLKQIALEMGYEKES